MICVRAFGPVENTSLLVITADDYGYAPAYDAGILEAARAGAIDSVSVFVLRDPDPHALNETGVEIGLHLEPPSGGGSLDRAAIETQLARFEELFSRPPAYLDGHKHCHASGGRTALTVARTARKLGVPTRSVSALHRRLLRYLGVPTADRVVGRMSETEPALPPKIHEWIENGTAPPGVTEWMVHPGQPDETTGSTYDRGRGEDLRLVLTLGDRRSWAARGIKRRTHAEALVTANGR
jgi:predicted glycoside hydrolase/deacetylase ChbG (UPF0249 family)